MTSNHTPNHFETVDAVETLSNEQLRDALSPENLDATVGMLATMRHYVQKTSEEFPAGSYSEAQPYSAEEKLDATLRFRLERDQGMSDIDADPLKGWVLDVYTVLAKTDRKSWFRTDENGVRPVREAFLSELSETLDTHASKASEPVVEEVEQAAPIREVASRSLGKKVVGGLVRLSKKFTDRERRGGLRKKVALASVFAAGALTIVSPHQSEGIEPSATQGRRMISVTDEIMTAPMVVEHIPGKHRAEKSDVDTLREQWSYEDGQGGEALLKEHGIAPSKWYAMQSELASKFPQYFYEDAAGNVGLNDVDATSSTNTLPTKVSTYIGKHR